MSLKYHNLLSPVKVGNTYLKNRMVIATSMPYFIQGPESYPSATLIEYFAKRAAMGASVVTVGSALPPVQSGKMLHGAKLDYTNIHNQNYYAHLTEAIHFHGAKACIILQPQEVPGYDASEGVYNEPPIGSGLEPVMGKEIPAEMLPQLAEGYAQQALIMKECGFDMVYLHCAYRATLPSRMLSSLTNKRTDEYGGPIENRARFLLMICKRIKELCGQDFIIDCCISGEEPDGGNTIEDTIALTKLAEGLVDIFQIRGGLMDPMHPTGYEKRKNPFLECAAKVKASNPKMLIAAISGFQDLDDCEAVISENKADLIYSARAWICDPEYGKKAYEGRGEDVVPCIRCNKCHMNSPHVTYNSKCSVNPTWGTLNNKISYLVKPSTKSCKIAIIGGGPAGMRAALFCHERGHEVTLFEKESTLGGQLKHADYASFKWPLKNLKDYLIKQLEKHAIDVRLNTYVTPDTLSDDYDEIIIAVGPKPIIPPIPGIDKKHVILGTEVFGRQQELGWNIVVIGGGEIGVEAGLYLTETGHNVFVIETQEKLCIDAAPIHYRAMVEDYWLADENFKFETNALCTEILDNAVRYKDKDGNIKEVPADNVVLAAGMAKQFDVISAFHGKAPYTIGIGDCENTGGIQNAMRTAFSAASKL